MTIEEMKEKKTALSSEIHRLIRDFECETGLLVEMVALSHGMRHEPTPVLIAVKLEVHL